MKVWVEINAERLAGNFRAVAAAAGAETELLAVVKANAYGHGLERCSVELARAGARWLGVTCVDEGSQVRRALAANGLEAKILVMCGFLPEDVKAFAEDGLTPVVWTKEQVGWLAGFAGMRVHVEVDTGMGRQGGRPGVELEELLAEMERAGLVVDGMMTHFCESEVPGSEVTRMQQERFEQAVGQLKNRRMRMGWVHAGNTSSVDNAGLASEWLPRLAQSVGARAMVRGGLALYGYCLPLEGGNRNAGRLRTEVKPVMQWKTRVLAVRGLAKGETVGYGATFTARRAMRAALLPVGYADGLRRELSSEDGRDGGWVMVRDGGSEYRRSGILGRVSMNLTVVDITGIAGVEAGDEVVLLGDGVTAEDHARLAETIPYDILCGVRER